MIPRTSPELMAVARGDRPADLVFTNAQVINVITRSIEQVHVSVFGGRIAGISKQPLDAEQHINLDGRYLAPGLIDAHMHVESTMMMPHQFVRVAAPHGTTGVVFDPHEIANVLGLPGIKLLMDASDNLPMNIMFSASSCVPSSAFETSGAELSASDLAPLFDDDRVVALAEMMNFPGVFLGDQAVLARVQLGLERAQVDGHCPGLSGANLGAYVAAGIGSDHECTTAQEALEKLALGMQIFIREGSAARNIEALIPAVTPENASRFCLCTDDRHPGDLHRQGHIDHAIREAVRHGLDPITALAIGSLHAAEHYRLPDLGAIAPGRQADLIVFEDLSDIRPTSVYFRGEHIAENGTMLSTAQDTQCTLDDSIARGSVRVDPGFNAESLRIKAGISSNLIRVIQADPHQLITGEQHMPPAVAEGHIVADPSRDLLKIAVIARHGVSSGIGLGFVTGFKFTNGALASTVGHDAHNLAVVGSNDQDMVLAVRTLQDSQGGQCVVAGGEVKALLPLPIAGLISDQDAMSVITLQDALLASVREMGCPIEDPFMPLSFLPLPVIPKLKITDLGLVDVEHQCIVALYVSENQ